MIQYQLDIRNDVYYLINTGGIDINYTLDKTSSCSAYLPTNTSMTGTILPAEETPLIFSQDGEFQLTINDGVNTDVSLTIDYYLNLQLSIIYSTFTAICNKCSDCHDECKISCNLLNARTKIDIYKKLTNPNGVNYFNTIYEETKCLVEKATFCGVIQELIQGKFKCEFKLSRQMLALDYLSIYFYELSTATNEEETCYIKNKFKVQDLFCCIEELGINISKIETAINLL